MYLACIWFRFRLLFVCNCNNRNFKGTTLNLASDILNSNPIYTVLSIAFWPCLGSNTCVYIY